MPSRAQSTHVNPAVGGSVAFTLSSSPADDSILVAVINFGLFGAARTTSPPGGASWTKYTAGCGNTTNDAIDVYWKKCASTGTGHTFTISEASEFKSGELFEFSGCDLTTPFNGTPTFATSASASSLAPSITPSATSCLPVAYFTQDNSGAGSSSFPAGWTLNELAATGGAGRGGGAGVRDTSTSDFSAVSLTVTIGAGPTECLAAILLMQPPQPEATFGAHANFKQRTRPAPFKPMGDAFQTAKFGSWR